MKPVVFTQYCLPDGRKQPITIDVDDRISDLASSLVARGVWFDIEILRTGDVSMSAERDDGGDVEVLAMFVVPNGPNIPNVVEWLVMWASRDIDIPIEDRDEVE